MLKIDCRYPFSVCVSEGVVRLLVDRPSRDGSQKFEIATDSSLCRFALMDVEAISPYFSSDCTIDEYCNIGKAYKWFALREVKARAEAWLQARFPSPQVIPVVDLPGDQMVRAIDLHYPGGWDLFLEGILEELDAKEA